jgi:hypothetical protein
MSCGSAYTTNLTKIRTKQNKCIRSIFFANHMESAITYYKLLGILHFDNIVKFKIATFAKKLSSDASKFPYTVYFMITLYQYLIFTAIILDCLPVVISIGQKLRTN